VTWRYRGPMEDFPEHWTIEVLDADHESVLSVDSRIRCDSPVNTPAEDDEEYPSRTCRHTYVPATSLLTGDFIMRVSGGALSAETRGTYHCGVSQEWPCIELLSPTPNDHDWLYQGDPIPVYLIVTPGNADLVIRLMRGLDQLYTHSIAATTCTGDESTRRCSHEISTNDLIPGAGYRIVVHSQQHEEARDQRWALSLIDRPFSETDPDAVDISLGSLRVTEAGGLEVFTGIQHRPGGQPRPETYELSYIVGKGSGASGGIRVEREVPNSSGWVDIGRIDTLVTGEEKRNDYRMAFTVRVNQPVIIVERDYTNNITEDFVSIRTVYAEVSLSGAAYRDDSGSPAVYFRNSGSRHRPHYETDLQLRLRNRGYAPFDGAVTVRQVARDAPGELASGAVYDRVVLGGKEIHLPAPENSPLGGMRYTDVVIPLFGDGISEPLWRVGELDVLFDGGFNNYGNPGPWHLEFRFGDY